MPPWWQPGRGGVTAHNGRRKEEERSLTDDYSPTRRELFRDAALLAGALSLPGLLDACGGSASRSSPRPSPHRLPVTSTEVVFADYGGTVRDARRRIFFEPFTAEYGVSVVSADASYPQFEALARAGAPAVDSIDVDGEKLVSLLAAGIPLQPLPPTVTRADLVVPAAYRTYTTGGYAFSYSQMFLPATFPRRRPESWRDFFDVDRFPGARAVPKAPVGLVEIALLADGVAPAHLYPLDWARGFARLSALRPHLLLYDDYAQGLRLLTGRSAAIMLATNARAFDLIKHGTEVVYQWNEQLLIPWSAMPLPLHAPHADAMLALMDLMARPDRQAAFAQQVGYGPTTSAAFSLLDDDTLGQLPNSPGNRKLAVTLGPDQLAASSAEYALRFQAWLAGAG